MDSTIFRKKSIERVSSPEQLNDYIRVSNPGIWVVLSACIILLIGICVWGIFGRLETKIPGVAIVKNGEMRVYIKEEKAEEIQAEMPVMVEEKEYVMEKITQEPVMISKEFSEYALHVGELTVGEWVCEISVESGELEDGVYSAQILTESIAPMTFLFN